MLGEIGNHKAAGSFHFISYFSRCTNDIGVVIRGKPSKYAISPTAPLSSRILTKAMPRYCMEILRRATSLSDSLLYKGFRAMFPGYCFSKAREAPDITLPESQAVRFIQLSRTSGPLCGRHVWKKPVKCETFRYPLLSRN